MQKRSNASSPRSNTLTERIMKSCVAGLLSLSIYTFFLAVTHRRLLQWIVGCICQPSMSTMDGFRIRTINCWDVTAWSTVLVFWECWQNNRFHFLRDGNWFVCWRGAVLEFLWFKWTVWSFYKKTEIIVINFRLLLQVNATNVTHVSPPSPFLVDTRRRPKMTLSSLDIEIDGSTFEHGSAHLKCVANIFNLYRKEVEFVLDEERPRPRPSSVLGTRDTASGKTFTYSKWLK